MLANQQPAPHFTLMCQDGSQHSLEDWAGKPLVLLFFRGRFCPTSKRYLNVWQDFLGSVENLGANLVAISSDSIENNAWMREQYKLKFPLLSDADMAISKQYGIYVATNKGKEFGEPAMVILDKDGLVAFSIISSGPKGLPDPGSIMQMLVYMSVHEGKY